MTIANSALGDVLAGRHLHYEHRFVLDRPDEGMFGATGILMMRYTMQHRPEATLE